MYPSFAKIAEEENLVDVAARLRAIALAEKHHQERYEKLLKEVTNQTFLRNRKKSNGYVVNADMSMWERSHPKNVLLAITIGDIFRLNVKSIKPWLKNEIDRCRICGNVVQVLNGG